MRNEFSEYPQHYAEADAPSVSRYGVGFRSSQLMGFPTYLPSYLGGIRGFIGGFLVKAAVVIPVIRPNNPYTGILSLKGQPEIDKPVPPKGYIP